jgi:hypothetical protein
MPTQKKYKKKVIAKTAKPPVATSGRIALPQGKPIDPLKYALGITACFFLVALFGMWHHEMWRDEHQAWLVARDASSVPGVFQNMRYEGNPALWHLFLFLITRVTHNPVFMQAFHLLIATGFIFVFNRYAPLKIVYKILFTFGYFPLYEYAIISRSYGLGVLLLFIVCALYKNRTAHYLLIAIILALLSNVTVYSALISIGLAGVLFLDYIFYQTKEKKRTLQLIGGLAIVAAAVIFSFYQIIPDKDNSFPAAYASKVFEAPRWGYILSKVLSSYFYIPAIQQNFWNTNGYLTDPTSINGLTYSQWLDQNPAYLWGYFYLPILSLLIGLIVFLRKPMILLLYSGVTLALLSVYYYTALVHSRYCGHLLITLVICYWLAEYYPDRNYKNVILSFFSRLGKRISKAFLFLVLLFNLIGAVVAYTMDYQYKFSSGKDAADYLLKNKLNDLPIIGITDFVQSPIATYLDKKIYYPQINDFGSFAVWSKKRTDQLTFPDLINAIDSLMSGGRSKLLVVKDSAPQLSDGQHSYDLEHAMIRKDLQMDLIHFFPAGIVADEKYYIYTVQKVDSTKVDFNKYPLINFQ